jgi:hypothetical protein
MTLYFLLVYTIKKAIMKILAASPLVRLGIPGLALTVAALFVMAAWWSGRNDGTLEARRSALRAVAYVTALLGVTGAVAAHGTLADLTRRPPPMMVVMVAVVLGTVFVARSALGRRIATTLPLWALVAAQAFRLPLEFVMRQAAREGVMPVQMSFEGYNFDVVTGTTALALGVALYGGRVPRGLVLAWNLVGSVLLAVVAGIAVASLPWVGAFGPDRVNDFVLYFPYVWLPTVLVPAALFGHIALFLRLVGSNERARVAPGSHVSVSARA